MDVNYNIYNDVRTTWKNKYLSNIYKLENIQTYIPIYKNFIDNKNIYKHSILNSKYTVERLKPIKNKENPYNYNTICEAITRKNYYYKYYKKKKEKLFIKFNPLIEPVGYIMGYYSPVNGYMQPSIKKKK